MALLGLMVSVTLWDFTTSLMARNAVLGTLALTSQTFHRPFVSQQPSVALQGGVGGGLAANEKTELNSQKMIVSRKTVTAKTYGGYVNVSRQTIDFSNP